MKATIKRRLAFLVKRRKTENRRPPTHRPRPVEALAVSWQACHFHPDVRSVAVCDLCGKALCNGCTKAYGELVLCPDDYLNLIQSEPPEAPGELPVRAPPGRASIGILLSVASCCLLLLNVVLAVAVSWAAELLLLQTTAGALAIGLLSGLGVLAGVGLRYLLGRETESGVIIVIFSMIGMSVGGGFFIGSVVGVSGGMLMLLGV